MVRARLLATIIALAAGAGAIPVAVARSAGGPTPSQERAAMARARSSRNLWATINVCAPRRAPHTIGVRGQMPALGFPAQLSELIQIEYWNKSKRRFVPVPGSHARALVRLGQVTAGLEQGGHNFPFAAQAGLLRGTVTFQWRSAGRLLGSASRTTVRGHPAADQGIPAHYTAGTCRLK